MKLKITGATPEQFAKRAFFLLWQACGGPLGMGVFQDRPNADEDKVWNNVMNAGDYSFGAAKSLNAPKSGSPYGDYVFGRMMKWGLQYDENTVTINDRDYRPDYQGWSRQYKDNDAIVKAVCASLNCTTEKA